MANVKFLDSLSFRFRGKQNTWFLYAPLLGSSIQVSQMQLSDRAEELMNLKMMKVGPPLIFYLIVSPWLCSATKLSDLEIPCTYVKEKDGVSLVCKNLIDPLELMGPVLRTIGYEMISITVANSTLQYLPYALFNGTSFQKVHLIDTALMTFSNGNLAFEGLEHSLTEFRASGNNYVSKWHLRELRNLKKLRVIDIQSIYVQVIPRDLGEFPNLAYFGVTNANVSHVDLWAFAKCPKLAFVGLNNNQLLHIIRDAFPIPANYLAVINLGKNKLRTITGDFFSKMPALTDVYLQDNLITVLEERVFSSLFTHISTLNMKGNPFVCTCKTFWFKKLNSQMWFVGDCAEPPSLRGRAIKSLEPWEMKC